MEGEYGGEGFVKCNRLDFYKSVEEDVLCLYTSL